MSVQVCSRATASSRSPGCLPRATPVSDVELCCASEPPQHLAIQQQPSNDFLALLETP